MGDEGRNPLHRWRCRWDWCGGPRLSRREEGRDGGYNPARKRSVSWMEFEGAPEQDPGQDDVHRQDRYISRHSERVQSIEWRLPAV